MSPLYIALIVSAIVFALGIILSVMFGGLFLFLILPFGFAWGIGMRRRNPPQAQQWRQMQQPRSPSGYCPYCGTRVDDALFCPRCGKPVKANINP